MRYRRRPVGLVGLLGLVLLLPTWSVTPAVAAGDEVTSVSAGNVHTCAVRTDGSAWCWGAGSLGQLGNGSTDSSTVPVRVVDGGGNLEGVKAVSAGGLHTCALKVDGSVWCWGWAGSGELGDGTTGDADGVRLQPVRVRRGAGFLTDAIAVSAGAGHSCAVLADRSAWCWGDDRFGQLGDGTTGGASKRRLLPVRVRRASGNLERVRSISAGITWELGAPNATTHSCATRRDGSGWCWGAAGLGQVGDGTRGGTARRRLTAVRVRRSSGPLERVAATSASGVGSCAVDSDRRAWCWGDGALTARRVRRGAGYLSNVRGIDIGIRHACAATTDGSAWCWGDNGIGDGTQQARTKAVRVRTADGFLGSVASVSAGNGHSCAATTGGEAWCWGSNEQGQIGNGSGGGGGGEKELVAVRVLFP